MRVQRRKGSGEPSGSCSIHRQRHIAAVHDTGNTDSVRDAYASPDVPSDSDPGSESESEGGG